MGLSYRSLKIREQNLAFFLLVEPMSLGWFSSFSVRANCVSNTGSLGQYYVYSLLAMLGGLPLGCLFGGIGIAGYSWVSRSLAIEHLPQAVSFGVLTAGTAVFIGILPAFLYGAPLYALLSKSRCANWFTVAVLGVLPGVVLLGAEEPIGWLVAVFGCLVALATHWIAAGRMRRLEKAPSIPPSR
jgi:hypothetical protein